MKLLIYILKQDISKKLLYTKTGILNFIYRYQIIIIKLQFRRPRVNKKVRYDRIIREK